VVRGSPHPACGHLLPIRCGEGIILWDVSQRKKTSDWLRVMRDSGRYPTSVPAPDAIKSVHFGANEADHLERITNRQVVGLPGEAKKQILERAKKYEADEVMLTMVTHKLSDKIESFRLLAEAFGL
jgi:hypothetical protein